MKFLNYIWDFGGTLFNIYPAYSKSVINILEKNGIEENFESIYKNSKISKKALLDYLNEKYQIDKSTEKNIKKAESFVPFEERQPFEFTEMILKYVVKNKGKNFIFTHRSYKSASTLLDHYHLSGYFYDIVTKDDLFERKPHPEGINHLINKHNLIEEQTITIGDRKIDIIAGKNANISTIYFNPCGKKFEIADYNIKNFKEILEIIK
ncbi:HAD-IA family hydrolase [Oceanotoga sp. DSM 15011]|jgi:HAD superfamily hydrolase (TIGR01549 family)|uniref:Phosphoglycolate phosphatase n=1 Tax=Oceanotoga teriensis TaxID=515440 RepID=A0AA45HJ81_9BACT|nr:MULTISPECIES: HAD-IA family hydrolase [Oceanotoga]MDN5343389.1 hypothetical protein [Oceanotoga sp.]MDO7976306.1 HAD-IA family hydrolase [Oceanotoga teriensis]PWJ95503.1 phosphoglycolate phosphatase [Oceanotoga teriensis]UYP01142.1 HAD-IA family hydrolase [Oceanotoga sp. DSM 15011]